jgi:carboxyl-terminal processing protease
MLRTDLCFCKRIEFFVLLLTSIGLVFFVTSGHTAPPIEEIRTIMAQKALLPPSFTSLAALNAEHLNEGLREMDPYARYVPPSTPSGNSPASLYLGIEVFVYKSKLWVRPDIDGPADKAGISEIVTLQAINNKKIHGIDLARISLLLDKAVLENRVVLTVVSLSDNKKKTYTIKPSEIKPSSITWRRIGADIFIRIREFVAHETAIGLSAIYKTLVQPGTRVVIDLRGCSGGDLHESLEIAGKFVPADLLLASTYDRNGVIWSYRAQQGQKLPSPIGLLIDHRTASAAEILAGILQHYQIAPLVGEQSYGKCVSQTLVPLSNGGSLWLTHLGINFPDNQSCTGNGLQSDISCPDMWITGVADIMTKIDNVISSQQVGNKITCEY